jgi:hypothetical protein
MLRPPPREPSPDPSPPRAPEEGGKRPRLGSSSYGRWTDEEDDYLISQAKMGTAHEQIAAHLRRGVKSIKTRLYIYGVHFPGDKPGLRAARVERGGAGPTTKEPEASPMEEEDDEDSVSGTEEVEGSLVEGSLVEGSLVEGSLVEGSPPPPSFPAPSPEDEVIAEFRAHRQFGGVALPRLERTWHSILYHYGVPAHRVEILLEKAGMRMEGGRIVDPTAPPLPRW